MTMEGWNAAPFLSSSPFFLFFFVLRQKKKNEKKKKDQHDQLFVRHFFRVSFSLASTKHPSCPTLFAPTFLCPPLCVRVSLSSPSFPPPSSFATVQLPRSLALFCWKVCPLTRPKTPPQVQEEKEKTHTPEKGRQEKSPFATKDTQRAATREPIARERKGERTHQERA